MAPELRELDDADWWHATCNLCTWRTRKPVDTKDEAVEAGNKHSQAKHPDSFTFRVRGYKERDKAAPAIIQDLSSRVLELLAKVLEYEHALEHVRDPHPVPGAPPATACPDCQRLAQSALDGVNREGFTEMARDALGLT